MAAAVPSVASVAAAAGLATAAGVGTGVVRGKGGGGRGSKNQALCFQASRSSAKEELRGSKNQTLCFQAGRSFAREDPSRNGREGECRLPSTSCSSSTSSILSSTRSCSSSLSSTRSCSSSSSTVLASTILYSTSASSTVFSSRILCSSSSSSTASLSLHGFSTAARSRLLRRSPFMGAGAGARLGLAVQRTLRRSGGVVHPEEQQRWSGAGTSPSSSSAARAVWKQEVLWAEAPVVEVKRAAEGLYHVVLDIRDNPELIEGHTKPGQFVQVKVGNTKPAFLAIASPPLEARKGRLEFLIKDPELEGSTAGMLCNLVKGDRVELSQVLGNGFKVEQLEPAENYGTVLLFATGSGISPIRSLIEAGFGANKRSDVRLYYGARNLQKMAYQEKFKDWEASGIQVVPVLSQPGSDWSGAQGYVQAVFSKNKAIGNAGQTGALLCGHKEMAQDVTGLLVSEGVSKEKILLNF